MVKKFIIFVLCLVISVSVCALAEEAERVQQEQFAPQQQMGDEQQPMEGMPGGMPPPPPEGMPGGMPPPPPEGMPGEVPPMGGNQPSDWSNTQGGRGPGGFHEMNQSIQTETQTNTAVTLKSIINEYFTPILSLILLGLAFVFVTFYKRKTY